MSGHSEKVLCVAIIENLIVSGSVNVLLYGCNATIGESIGSASQEHEGPVDCVAVKADL